jgi:hypothetical protein
MSALLIYLYAALSDHDRVGLSRRIWGILGGMRSRGEVPLGEAACREGNFSKEWRITLDDMVK